MFATFTPVHEGKGEPLHGEVVIVNMDNVTRITPVTSDQGWGCEGLVIDTNDGKRQWVYLAPKNADKNVIAERMADLGVGLDHSGISEFGESMWSPEEDNTASNV